MASDRQPTPPGPRTPPPPPRNKGLIAGLLKGSQWLISPKNKAGYFWGGWYVRGGWLIRHNGFVEDFLVIFLLRNLGGEG